MFLNAFWILVPYQYMIRKYFLPFSKLFLYFGDGFLCWSEAIQFDVILLVYFALVAWAFDVLAKKIIAETNAKKLFPCVFF